MTYGHLRLVSSRNSKPFLEAERTSPTRILMITYDNQEASIAPFTIAATMKWSMAKDISALRFIEAHCLIDDGLVFCVTNDKCVPDRGRAPKVAL